MMLYWVPLREERKRFSWAIISLQSHWDDENQVDEGWQKDCGVSLEDKKLTPLDISR